MLHPSIAFQESPSLMPPRTTEAQAARPGTDDDDRRCPVLTPARLDAHRLGRGRRIERGPRSMSIDLQISIEQTLVNAKNPGQR